MMELAVASAWEGTLAEEYEEVPAISLPALVSEGWPAPGERVGSFALEAVLGAGAHGVVYRACKPELPERVAVKVLSRPGPSAEAAERFRAEVDAVRSNKLTGVVRVIDMSFDSKWPFVATELIEGESLADRAAELPQDPYEAAEWMESAARAIHQLHEAGVVHRDLKPQNLLFGPDGSLRVSDSGVAGLGGTIRPSRYSAPELCSGEKASLASDIYSLGVILRELLTGIPEETPLTEVPASLREICLQCLDPNPAQRPATAEQLANALRASLREAEGTVQRRGVLSRAVYRLSLGFIDLG